MMRLKVCSSIFFLLLTTVAFAQYRLSGTLSIQDSTVLRKFTVRLNDGSKTAITDQQGRFLFEDLPNGSYVVHFSSEEFEYYAEIVKIADSDQHIRVALQPRTQVLEEVVVTDVAPEFGFTRMRSVEGTGIYEGKKSEVILPEQLVANIATNNARQVYSRVAGLNIWENDGAGIQLSIGGRGLDPNRTSNFNVRQNGHDISADALGYPESYYTPPVEGVGRIQIVRGAASLQYGTQFGGLINFAMKTPVRDRKFELLVRQTGGSYGFYNSFMSISGTVKKLSYYSFFQYKRGDGWRPNSHFDNHTLYANVAYALTDKTKIGLDITQMGYLAQQPGGLTDDMFAKNPRQSNRERNWFSVQWNMAALHFDHQFSAASEFNLRVFGLHANRYSLGFRNNRVQTIDDGTEDRDLIKGNFENWGAEARYMRKYEVAHKPSVALFGVRYYRGFNHSRQGFVDNGDGANFKFGEAAEDITYDYEFPNQNTSVFVENILYLHEKLSLTPGIRYEYINTVADGFYGFVTRDLAGNIIDKTTTDERRINSRQFVIAGLGVSYRPAPNVEVYSNLSQNYRSITFNDMRISNPSSEVDQNLQDEKGYSFDLGARSEQTSLFNYDVSLFYLNYDNRIGDLPYSNEQNIPKRLRTNIGQAVIKGVEAYGEIDFLGYLYPEQDRWSGVVFTNVGLIHSRYTKSKVVGVKGNKVEFVPDLNLKTGVRIGYGKLKASLQYTYLSKQFTEATNAPVSDASAVIGPILSYSILDMSASYQIKKIRIEASVNNLANEMYFTRRATGYPGPGIIPSDGRSFFLTLQAKL